VRSAPSENGEAAPDVTPDEPVRGWSRPSVVGALTGLLAGLAILGPALGPGFLLVYDMVFVPEPNFGARTLGLDGSVPRAVPNDLVVSVLSLLLPGWVVQKVLLLTVFVLVGAGLGALARTRSGAAVAALAASWNPYVAERLALGHWAFLLGYALLPWVAGSAAAALAGDRAGRRRLALWLTAAALCGSTAAVIATLVAVAVLAVPLAGRRAQSGARLRGLVVVGLVTAGANAVWWVPAVLIPGRLPADADGVSAFAARADSPWGLLGSVLTGGGLWHDGLWPVERGSLVLTAAALALVVACVAWAVVHRRRVHPALPGLLLAGAVGLVVACAGSPVLSDVATAVVTHLPGGGLIRDSHKFVAPWVVLVACSAGALVDDLRGPASGVRQGFTLAPATRVTLAVGLGVLPVVLLPSLAAGSFRDWGAAHYPASYLAAAARVDSYDDAAVASFPWTLYRRYGWNRDDVVLDPWSRLVEAPVLVNDDLPLAGRTIAGEDPRADRIEAAVTTGSPERVRGALEEEGVRFVVLHLDQPSSAEQAVLFAEEEVVVRDRWIVLYDLGPVAAVADPLPRWSWVGLALSSVTGLVVLAAGVSSRRRARH
jgi:hypothetical protein